MADGFAVGGQVGGFLLQGRLGRGAAGEVWAAVDVATGEPVALKRARPGARERLLAEATVLRSLSSPHVVRLRAVLERPETALVLDLLPGGSLADLLARRGVLPPGEAVTVAVGVARGLAAAHERGLVHGDLSPANVLFTASGTPVLIDLGRSWSGAGPELVGTAGYVDPAQTAPGPAADVWALGALTVHLLTGDPPYAGVTAVDGIAAAARGERAPLGLLAPAVPRAVVAAVEQSLSPDPAQRPAAASFAAALLGAVDPVPVRWRDENDDPVTGRAYVAAMRETEVIARYEPTHAAPGRARRRPPLSVIGVALVVLGLLGGGLTWAVRGAGDADAYTALPALAARPAGSPSPQPPAAPPPTSEEPSSDATSAGAVAPGDLTPEARHPSASATPTGAVVMSGTPAALPTDWPTVVDALDQTRESAFSVGSPTLLAEVYAAGSAVGASDTAALDALVRQGRTVSGVRHQLRGVTAVQTTSTGATLRVTDTLDAQVVLDDLGNAVERRPGRGEQTYELTLVAGPDGWRINKID
jgi:hypothetical protein